jgi:predicted O-methyltransferase YrrM
MQITKVKNNLKPWMGSVEIDIIETILLKLKPAKCLEWGSGFSTFYFTNFISSDASWISIEHNRKWFEKLKKSETEKIISLYHIKPNNYPWTDKYKDGSAEDLKDYVNFPARFKYFDFILIDGRARNSCILKAREIISPEGIVVLHDANRKYYYSSFNVFENQVYLKDNKIIDGDLWIASVGQNPLSYLSPSIINNHYKVFNNKPDSYY